MEEEKCCVVSCEKPLDQTYWDNQYQAQTIGWDLGTVSPAIKRRIDAITDKNATILIPGCGNTYEAEYLLQEGFTAITVLDIAPTLVENLKQKFKNATGITVLLGDFFEHNNRYDYIIEQTFFCALPPTMRQQYVWKMHQLLAENGILFGLLFNRDFEVSPPFGGSKTEYEMLFKGAFTWNKLETSNHSIPQRANSELEIELHKNKEVVVNFYDFEGITCSGCKNTVSTKFAELNQVVNVSMSSDFASVIITSTTEVAIEVLQQIVAYDTHYKIVKHEG